MKLKGDDYNLILSIFFVPYVLFAPLVGVIGKKFGPSRVLPILMFCFGFSTLMIVAVKNFGDLLACRWFLGMVCMLAVLNKATEADDVDLNRLKEDSSRWSSITSRVSGRLAETRTFGD